MKRMKQTFVSFVIVSLLVGFVSAFSQTPSEEESLAHWARASAEQDTIYYVAVETLPEPIGGIAAIQQNVKYPEAAKRAGIQGTVFVEAFLDEKGNVVDLRIIRGVAEDRDRLLDRAAEEAIRATKFKPGMLRGKPVKVRMAIPIRFRLDAPAPPLPPDPEVDRPTILVAKGPKPLEKFMTYPEHAISAGVHGTVYATIQLTERWQVKQLSIVSGIGAGCDEQVLKALLAYEWAKDPAYSLISGLLSVDVAVKFLLPKRLQEKK
jgi:TonB family protein